MYRSGRSRGADALGREYESLSRDQRRHVDGVIEEARKRGSSAARTVASKLPAWVRSPVAGSTKTTPSVPSLTKMSSTSVLGSGTDTASQYV